MPVKIRLAKKGASRKGSIAMELLSGCVEGFDQQIDIVVEELEVVVHAFFSTDRWQVHDYLRAGVPSNRLRCLEVKIGLDQYHLAVLPPHQLDQFHGMGGCRRNPRPRLHVADHVEAEVFGEVGE